MLRKDRVDHLLAYLEPVALLGEREDRWPGGIVIAPNCCNAFVISTAQCSTCEHLRFVSVVAQRPGEQARIILARATPTRNCPRCFSSRDVKISTTGWRAKVSLLEWCFRVRALFNVVAKLLFLLTFLQFETKIDSQWQSATEDKPLMKHLFNCPLAQIIKHNGSRNIKRPLKPQCSKLLTLASFLFEKLFPFSFFLLTNGYSPQADIHWLKARTKVAPFLEPRKHTYCVGNNYKSNALGFCYSLINFNIHNHSKALKKVFSQSKLSLWVSVLIKAPRRLPNGLALRCASGKTNGFLG